MRKLMSVTINSIRLSVKDGRNAMYECVPELTDILRSKEIVNFALLSYRRFEQKAKDISMACYICS